VKLRDVPHVSLFPASKGRFYSAVLDEPHFWAALRYVERNPVRVGIVQRAEDYRWSSAPAHCGLCDDPLLAPLPAGASLISDWSAWLRDGETHFQLDLIRKCTKTGRPCGSESFLRELEGTTGRILIPRRVGRPSKQDLITLYDCREPTTTASKRAPQDRQKHLAFD
jgi:putative transposase